MTISLRVFLFYLLVAWLTGPADAQRSRANFSVARSSSGEFILWNGNRYRIIDPRGARDETTLRILGGAMREMGVAFGVSDGLTGQRVAIECIFWVQPNPFGHNYQRSCQLPNRIAFTGFGSLVEFAPEQWQAFRAALERQYPGSVTAFGTSRSAIVLGTIGLKGFNFARNRSNFLAVEGWIIVGNTSDYETIFEDAVRLMELGGQVGRVARSVGR